jgi:uncharacterized repeat protein (TIGR01451 family)
LTSEYVSYQITNTDGVNYPDVWATIGNFTAASGPTVVTLGATAASAIDLGPLANGQTKTAFFYLGNFTSTLSTNILQTHTVSVFNGPPATGTLLTSQDFSLTVQQVPFAASNTVNSVVISPSNPTLGGTFTMTVTGQTGTINFPPPPVIDFTPAAFTSWRADAFQLIGSTITLASPNAGTFTDTLLIPPAAITSPNNTNYTAVYTFHIVAPTSTPTALSPVTYISSSGAGSPRHTNTSNYGALAPVPPARAEPTLRTIPTPTTIPVGTTPVTLKDEALLENGFNPTGTITFTLLFNGTQVHTETLTVNGNGKYTTPTGFTPPGGATATGTYQWNITYGGDTLNNGASIINDVSERVTVTPATPKLVTLPVPITVTLGDAPTTLKDAALLVDGFNPTGTITFTLLFNGTQVHTETVTVSGNGEYTTPTGFPLPNSATGAGTYQWTASYSGDGNNTAVSDSDPAVEQTTVVAASPELVTTPIPNTLAQGVTLTDEAFLQGGFSPTGTITFTLLHNGTQVDTETVSVNGNGTYTTPNGFLPVDLTGTYQWNAVYSGDAFNNGASDIDSPTELVTPAPVTLSTTAIPTTVQLGADSVTLKDLADLEGGTNPTGTITFTLFFNGGTTPVHTETVPVSGAAAYLTPTGFTLTGTGTVAGTYHWTATFTDTSGNSISDNNPADELVTVLAATPKLVTLATPTTVPTVAAPVTLKDEALLENGFNPTGTITFTLLFNGTLLHTETVTVNGNGTYATPTGFVLPAGSATGTYQWNATYTPGDSNNNPASIIDDVNEEVTVGVANLATPRLITLPTPATVTLGAVPVTLKDTALLNGINPTGTITFTLFLGGVAVHTETVTVDGNGTYVTPTGFTLPSTGPVTGTYQWVVSYSGDASNNAVTDEDSATEQVTVSAAIPTLVTVPNPTTVTLGATAVTLTDSATLANCFNPTGIITFTLFLGGTAVHTETVTVNGNGTYATPTGFLPTAAGTYQWVASYSSDANNDPVASELGDEPQTVTPAQVDLAVTKVANQTQVMFGDTVTFTLTVVNKGPSTATDVVVVDPLPPGLDFVSATPSQGTYNPASGLWMVGTLAPGASATLQVTATVATVGPIGNTAEASALQFDPDLSNNVATATVTGSNPGSSISKRSFLADPASVTLPSVVTLRADIVFINGLYRDLLGRDAEPGGLAGWLDQLLLGSSRSAVAQGVRDSAEHRGLEVDQFYRTLLHRPADPGGRAFWVADLLAGASESDVEAGFLSSAEYRAAHPTDAAFVAGLYQDVLGRAGEPAGLAGWLAQLQGGVSRDQVIAGFVGSQEALGRAIDRDYASYLSRAAEAGGRQYFLNQLLAGGPRQEEAVGVAILASDEFFIDAAGA